MDGYKTIVFAIVALLSEALRLAGYEIGTVETEGLANSIVTLIGIGGAIYGRLVAKKDILTGGPLE